MDQPGSKVLLITLSVLELETFVRKLFADVIGDESSSLISIGSHVFSWITVLSVIVDNVDS